MSITRVSLTVHVPRCTSGGVYVPCIYTHARSELPLLCLCDVFLALINSLVCCSGPRSVSDDVPNCILFCMVFLVVVFFPICSVKRFDLVKQKNLIFLDLH